VNHQFERERLEGDVRLALEPRRDLLGGGAADLDDRRADARQRRRPGRAGSVPPAPRRTGRRARTTRTSPDQGPLRRRLERAAPKPAGPCGFAEDRIERPPMFREYEGNVAVRIGSWKLVRRYS
jgi:hypothetical protein